MSPTSYQAAPPRVRDANLIEGVGLRQGSPSAREMPSPLPSPGGRGGRAGSWDGCGFLWGEGAAGIEEDNVFGVDEVELFAGGFFGGELAAAGGGDGGAEVGVLAPAVGDLLVELADLGVR